MTQQAEPACRRCTECVGMPHHWLLPDHDPETDECFVECKHCEFRATLCESCLDMPIYPVVDDSGLCEACKAEEMEEDEY